MNYGWLPPAGSPTLQLAAEDEPERYFIGLYSRLTSNLPLQGAQVLEVGSGRGGGASWVTRYHQPVKLIGLDFSNHAIEYSRRQHSAIQNLEFVEGDAMALPFPDAAFDVVLNVESSHCYADMARFAEEAARVLRPGGLLGWVDMRSQAMIARTEEAFQRANLIEIEADELNEGVVRALDAANEQKNSVIAQLKFGTQAFREFAGVKGSFLYGALAKKEVLYLLKVYRKPNK